VRLSVAENVKVAEELLDGLDGVVLIVRDWQDAINHESIVAGKSGTALSDGRVRTASKVLLAS